MRHYNNPKMVSKNNITLILFLFFFSVQKHCSAKIINLTDSLTYKQKLYSGKYPPYFKLTDDDKIQLPVYFDIELNIDEIRDFDIKSDYFYTTFFYSVYTKLDTLEITKNKDSLYWYPEMYMGIEYPEGDKVYAPTYDLEKEKRFYSLTKDSLNDHSRYMELELPHKWDLRDYPFDTQNLNYIFYTSADTSNIMLRSFKDQNFEKVLTNFNYLKDGYKFKSIDVKEVIEKDQIVTEFADGFRNKYISKVIFSLEINRSGSYLFFKLFFGGFLSFLISYLVFFIEPKYFETRITLSLGGIFGAVGNKYFVENSMPALQVLTKADLINNLVIIFIILNIFIVIAQHTSKISLWKFENNKFSSIFIFILFILMNVLIVKS